MLVKITNYCSMGCSHCLEDSTVAGKHMTRETFLAALGLTVDVTSEEELAAAFAQVGRDLGSPTILVNAAGITTWEDSLEGTKASWSTVIEATRRVPFASSSTLAMASPELMLVTRAGIWFRALRGMSGAPLMWSGVLRPLPYRVMRSAT